MPLCDAFHERVRVRQQTLLDRRVRDDRPTPLAHPGDEIPLDAASFEVVQDLVRHEALEATFDPGELLHVVDVEIAHARIADLLRLEEILESRERLPEWHLAAPVKKVEVDLLGIEPAETSVAGHGHALARGVLGIELRHDEHLIAAARDRLADDALGAAICIHLRRVDEVHSEIDPGAQRGDFARALALVFSHTPRALAEHGYGLAARERRGTNTRHRMKHRARAVPLYKDRRAFIIT